MSLKALVLLGRRGLWSCLIFLLYWAMRAAIRFCFLMNSRRSGFNASCSFGLSFRIAQPREAPVRTAASLWIWIFGSTGAHIRARSRS